MKPGYQGGPCFVRHGRKRLPALNVSYDGLMAFDHGGLIKDSCSFPVCSDAVSFMV